VARSRLLVTAGVMATRLLEVEREAGLAWEME
jgi:hypothetical protein